GSHQVLLAARRRLRPAAAEAQQTQVATHGLQLATTGGAGLQVFLEGLPLGAGQLVQRVQRQVLRELFMRAHSKNLFHHGGTENTEYFDLIPQNSVHSMTSW